MQQRRRVTLTEHPLRKQFGQRWCECESCSGPSACCTHSAEWSLCGPVSSARQTFSSYLKEKNKRNPRITAAGIGYTTLFAVSGANSAIVARVSSWKQLKSPNCFLGSSMSFQRNGMKRKEKHQHPFRSEQNLWTYGSFQKSGRCKISSQLNFNRPESPVFLKWAYVKCLSVCRLAVTITSSLAVKFLSLQKQFEFVRQHKRNYGHSQCDWSDMSAGTGRWQVLRWPSPDVTGLKETML